MPPLSRWYIRTSLLYLVATFLTAVAASASRWLPPSLLPGVTDVYYHLFMLGWVSQLIFGVAYWIFPVYTREAPRRSERLAWAAYALLNLGLIMRVLGQLAFPEPTQAGRGLLVVGALFIWLGSLLFVVNSWGRVKHR